MPLSFTVKNLRTQTGVEATLIEVVGAVDSSTTERFQGVMDGLIHKGSHNLILDLLQLKYVNTTGLGILQRYRDELKADGGDLVLVRPSKKTRLILEMLGFDAEFSIEPDELAAFKHFTSG